ncbi:MAG: APC family permease [Gemmatimonadaceae bacterium]|nr:APC family permease [Gemmatimonadaceae bacterium]
MTDGAALDGAAVSTDAGLVRVIGTVGLTASIVNVTVGGGIFRLPASTEVTGRLGAAAPLAYVACAVVMGLIVLCIAEAGRRVSLTGGPYAYVEATFGPYIGFLVGVMLWLLGCTAMPAVAGVLADTVGRAVPTLATPMARALLLAVTFAVVAAINVLGVRQGTRLNTVLTVAKLGPLLLLLFVGLFAVRGANLAWHSGVPSAPDISRASVFLIFAFAGVESALVPSGEVRDPTRTVPRAVLIAMALVTVLYIGLQTVAQGVLGPALVGDPAPLATAAGHVLGPSGATILGVGFIISAFGYLSGMTLAVPRALFAFARDGFLPRRIADVHPRFHTPWIAIIVQSALAWILAVTNGFEGLAIIANVSAALVYLGCAAAAWRLRPRGNIRAAIVPVLAALALLFLLSSVTLKEWSVLLAVTAVASLAFMISRRRAAVAVPAP